MAVSSGAIVVGETAVALNEESGATAGTRLYLFNGDEANSVALGDAEVAGDTGRSCMRSGRAIRMWTPCRS